MVELWDPSIGYASVWSLRGHNHPVTSVRFLRPGGSKLASSGRDGTIRIWNALTGACIRTVCTESGWVRDISPSSDGRWLVSAGDDNTATLWEISTGAIRSIFRGHELRVECCILAPPESYSFLAGMAHLRGRWKPPTPSSAEFVVTGSRDRTINIWDANGPLVQTLIGHDSWVRGLAFSPCGRFLLSVGDDGTIRFWDLAAFGRLVHVIEDQKGLRQLHPMGPRLF
ncbi:nuclear migration protein NudF [Penicillium chermesinum]|nr:nuclear migration protein NudF [Penicillium chermesinum]